MSIKKNKLHNPQIITEQPPEEIVEKDIGRIWIDKTNNNMRIALNSKVDGTPELRNMLDTNDLLDIDKTFYKGVSTELATIVLQENGDSHYDNGYDFFNDSTFLNHSTQEYDDYYAYFYKEVEDTDSPGYLRSIATDDGTKHIRIALGDDTYEYDNDTYNLVNYSKIVLQNKIKDIIDITFSNKDSIQHGYTLLDDNQTILIYIDPEGLMVGEQVTIKYLI